VLLAVCAVSSFAQTDAGVPAAAPPSDPVVVKIAMGKGITVSKGEALSMTVRARFQIRDVATIQDTAVSNEFSLRTARLFIHGKVLSPKLCYFVQLALGQNDFEAGITSPVFDAFVEWTGWRDLNIKAGQFFVPFDRARTIREVALQLVDRQQVITELGMDRDLGIALSSQDLFGWGGRLSYTLGFFGGQGKNRVLPEKNPGFLYTARVAFRPMGAFDDDVEADIERSVNPHLSVGLAFAYNQNTLRAKGVIGPIYTLKGFDQLHLAADVVFKWRGFSLLAEVIMRQANEPFHDGETASGAPLREWSRSGWGYLVQAGYMVTPNLEVAARWDQVRFISGDPALSQLAQTQGREFGAGLNWYFNGHLAKVQADYTIRFGDGSVAPTHMARAAIDVSF
jgi:hypothetical protein